MLLTVQTEVPDPPVMLVGLQVTVRPVEGLTVVVRLTVPVKLLMGVMIVWNWPVEPFAVNVRVASFKVKGELLPLM